MIRSMADQPIIFAMANPDPEITPEEVAAIRDDAIVATGRSDYPNQVNNVLGFPYIFRGALDVRATTINEEMKVAAAQALAALAREDVPDEVAAAYQGVRPKFGPQYIIPVPFDSRLLSEMPAAVAKAAMDTGVARRPIGDMAQYKVQLSARRDPIVGTLQRIFQRVRRTPKRVVFAEGEEEQMIRAAASFVSHRLGTAILIGREETVRAAAERAGIDLREGVEINNARLSTRNAEYIDFLYARLQRKGYLLPRRAAPDQFRPQPFRRLHGGARRRRRHGLGRDAQLLDGAGGRAPGDRPEARPPGDRHLDGAGARPHGAGRRHRGARHADAGGACRHRRGGGRRGAPHGLHAARGAARLFDLRPAGGRARQEGAARRWRSSTSAGSTSSTTARWPPTWRSIRS